MTGDGARLWREGSAASVARELALCQALPARWREGEAEYGDCHLKRDDAVAAGWDSRSHSWSRSKG